jgi:hypothetical protein
MFIKRLLKIIDLYGTRFHWYIGYKPKHYTFYGGIFSILSLIISATLLVILGYDDFKRSYPIISTSTIPPNGYKNIKFGEKKLYLPWRIVDYDEKPLDIKGIIYPKIYYFTNVYNSSTGKMDSSYSLVNYTLCNETSMKNLGEEFLLDIQLDKLYCIDMENLEMGGSFNAEFMNYIRLDIYLCENGIKYDENNNRCTPYDKFDELHKKNNAWFFEILYPKVQFQPTEKKFPILILYQTYYYIFSKYANKLDRIYLQEHVLEDEKGWVFNRPFNLSYWGTYSIGGENYYRGETDILKYSSNSRLYSLKIYLNLGITFYTRKYKKLYEILSEIFLIVKAVFALFAYISEELNDIFSAKKINELILNFERKNNSIINKRKFEFKGTKSLTFMNNKIELINIKLDESQSKKIIFQNKKNKINNKPNGIDDSSNLDIKNNFKDSINLTKYRGSVDSSLKIEKMKYPIRYYLYGYCIMKLKFSKKNNKMISKNFLKSFVIYRHLIDISCFITLYKQFEIVKKIITNKINNKDEYEENNEIIFIDKHKNKKI